MATTQPQATGKGQAAGSRFIVRETGDGLGIVVPLARHKGLVFTLGMFLLYWVFITFFDLFAAPGFLRQQLLAGGRYVLWLLAGAAGAVALAWKLFGTERLFIVGGSLVLSRGLGPLGRRSVFPLDEVRNARIKTRYVPTGYKGRTVLASTISFQVRGKTYDFGADMEAEERSSVYHAMLRHLPPQANETENTQEPEGED